MSVLADKPVTIRPIKNFIKSVLLTLPMLLLTLVLLTGGAGFPTDVLGLISFAINYLLVNSLFFMMIYTGRTDSYRAVLFVFFAVCFIIFFIGNLLEVRGSMLLSRENLFKGETPFCHMVIPMAIIPAVLTRTIIFPGSLLNGFAAVATMLIIWFGASLILGRGFCSWGCFYGGLEDGISRLRRKPSRLKIDLKWRYLPFAVLLFIVLTSAATLSPTYCAWLCPFKAVTEFEPLSSWPALIFTVVFFSLFLGLVIILPFLTRRRTQCGLFCPFGAFQSLTNKICSSEVRIDPGRCINCGRCIEVCPTFSMDRDSLAKGKTTITCCKCGKCIDHCPRKAIYYHTKGTPLHHKTRLLFLYPAFLFLATFSGGIIQKAIHRVLLLVTTGSMLIG